MDFTEISILGRSVLPSYTLHLLLSYCFSSIFLLFPGSLPLPSYSIFHVQVIKWINFMEC